MKELIEYIKGRRFDFEIGSPQYHLLNDLITTLPVMFNLFTKAEVRASCEATLKKAAENAKITITGGGPTWIDKSSITNPENIVIIK